jgi:hypothetical protein
LAGGAAGKIPYQTGSGATSFTAAGTSGQVLTSAGTGTPTWQTAGAASTVSGGAAGEVLYQSAVGTTAFTAVGTSGQVLTSAGAGTPTWSTPNSTAASGNFTIAGDLAINGTSPTQQIQINPNLIAGTFTSQPYASNFYYQQGWNGIVEDGSPVVVIIPLPQFTGALFKARLITNDALDFVGDGIEVMAQFYSNSINVITQRGSTTTLFNQGAGKTTLTVTAPGAGPNPQGVYFTITSTEASNGLTFVLWIEWLVAKDGT